MNIENITALAATIESLGFKGLGGSLLKRIAFKPVVFNLPYNLNIGEEKIHFELFFRNDEKNSKYIFLYYEASLHNEATQYLTISGIDTRILEKRMTAIDWKSVFDLSKDVTIDLNRKTDWETEEVIEGLIADFEVLEVDNVGKEIAARLKSKFWTGLPYEMLTGSMHAQRRKNDISQRFYYLDGKPSIGADEASRFLLNRRMEKELFSSKKTKIKDSENQDTKAKKTPIKKRLSKKHNPEL